MLLQVTAVDKSEAAAAWARYNVERLGLQSRVRVLLGSWCEPVQQLMGSMAGILSNPPYITSAELPTLQTEVKPNSQPSVEYSRLRSAKITGILLHEQGDRSIAFNLGRTATS